MKITAHFDNTPFIIFPLPPDGSTAANAPITWAQRTQRFVEESLLETQKLLQLLASLSSSLSPSSGVGRRYQLRFGGGYATLIHVIWSDGSSSRGSSPRRPDGDWEEDVIEANITFRPRDDSFDEFQPSDMMPTWQNNGLSESLHVDVIVEIIGFEEENYQSRIRGGGGDTTAGENNGKRGGGGEGRRFPMTQVPFPVDERKMNFLRVWEHARCRGVANNYSLRQWTEGFDALWLADAAAENVVVQANAGRATNTTSSKERLDEESNNVNGMTSSTQRKGGGTSKSASLSARKSTEGKDKGVTPSKRKGLTAVGDGDALEGSKSTTEKAKSTSKTPSNARQSQEDGALSSTVTKQKTKKRKKAVSSEQETETPPPPKHQRKLSTDDEDAPNPDSNLKGKKNTPSIKRPPNTFMLFLDDVRPELKSKFPGISTIELSTKAGALYRELTEEDRHKYASMAKLKLAQFNEEHPELSKTTSKASRAVDASRVSNSKEGSNGEKADGGVGLEKVGNEKAGKKTKKHEKAEKMSSKPASSPLRALDASRVSNSKEGANGEKADGGVGLEKGGSEKKTKKHEKMEKKSSVAPSKPASSPLRAVGDTQVSNSKEGASVEKEDSAVVVEKGESEKKTKKIKKKKKKSTDTRDKDDSEEESDDKKSDNINTLDNTGGNEPATKPKRPLNAFWLYASEVREEVKAVNPELNPAAIMREVAKTYERLDVNEKKRYQDRAAKASADFKEKYGEDAMKLGSRSKAKAGKKKQKEAISSVKSVRNDGDDSTGEMQSNSTLDIIPYTPAKGMPAGWRTRAVPRKNQSNRTKADTVWYSPVESYKFLSVAQAKKFQEMVEQTNGDETKAYRLLHPHGKQMKGADAANAAVNDSNKSKKDKKEVAEKSNDKVKGSSDRKEDDEKLVAEKSDDEDDGISESEEDDKRVVAKMSEDEDEETSESEEDDKKIVAKMSDDEDSSRSEEDEMPEAWLS